MKEYQIVIVDFFTEAKRLAILKAETHDELEGKVKNLGKKNPTSLVVAYSEGEIAIGTRPARMIEELEEVKESGDSPIGFILKWRVLPSGEQILPDYSLPKVRKKAVKQLKVASAKPSVLRQKPSRANFKEIVPQAAGV